eukprot:2473507-Prymnesium_polylepis.1
MGRNAWNHSGRRTSPCVVIATTLTYNFNHGDACRSLRVSCVSMCVHGGTARGAHTGRTGPASGELGR